MNEILNTSGIPDPYSLDLDAIDVSDPRLYEADVHGVGRCRAQLAVQVTIPVAGFPRFSGAFQCHHAAEKLDYR